MEQPRDEKIWRKAKRITKFKRHLFTYLVINAFLWIIWWINSPGWNFDQFSGNSLPWPAWAMIGWGIGLLFDYYDTYHNDGESATEKEYQKLKNK